MSKTYKVKISYKELPGQVILNLNIFDDKYAKYEEIKKSLIDKSSKKKEFKPIKVTEKDKFVLEIEGHEIPGLKEIFNEATYKFFSDYISEHLQEKLKLLIVKVDDYPKWKPPMKNMKNQETSSISSKDLNSPSSLNAPSSSIKKEFCRQSTEPNFEDGKKNQIKVKIYYRELPSKVVQNLNLLDNKYNKYEEIKKVIIEKSKKNEYKSIRVTEKDKFVLEIEGIELAGLTQIWDEGTYKYFYDNIEEKRPDKLKLNIVKVKEYPEWKPPKFYTILVNTLNSEWDNTKNEVKKELNEQYLEKGKQSFIQSKKEEKIKENNLSDDVYNDLHVNVICKKCLISDFLGVRYICSECDNFNLCEYCFDNKTKLSHNPEHVFIKSNRPISTDSYKYNSIFSPNKIYLQKSYEPFEIEIKVINNGKESLQGCFLSPIRFGKNYLGCLKTTITDICEIGEQFTLNPLIKFEDINNNEPKDEYEGYFRLFSEEGLPFGDILYIQVLIEK